MPSLLVVITTNRERDLPPAFVRRCVVHELEMPKEKDLLAIARMRFGDDGKGLHEAVARVLFRLRTEAGQDSSRRPATAEYLDAIRACRDLGIGPPAAEGHSSRA
jgi:MoxR-like ATPase